MIDTIILLGGAAGAIIAILTLIGNGEVKAFYKKLQKEYLESEEI